MSAGSELQKIVVAGLKPIDGLVGVWDGAPSRAAYPYAIVDTGREKDWATKDRDGREVTLSVTLWDEQPERLYTLSDSVEERLTALSAPDGWQLVTLRFVKRRVLRDVAGPWAVGLDYKVRLLAA